MVKAVAVLRGESNIRGTVTFEQPDENTATTITWNISGQDPNANRGFPFTNLGTTPTAASQLALTSTRLAKVMGPLATRSVTSVTWVTFALTRRATRLVASRITRSS